MKVLIADDHELIRRGLRQTLTDLVPEAVILEAANGDQVLATVEADPDLGLVVLDLFMPGHAGFALLGRLCDEYPEIAVVVLSASEKPEHMRKAIDLGAAGFIPKAAGTALMRQALGLVLAGGVYIPPQMLGKQRGDGQMAPVPAPGAVSLQEGLTDRQMEVLRLIGQGRSNKEIAQDLGLSLNTVKIHVAAILRALDVDNRTQAAIVGQRMTEGFGGPDLG